MPLRLLSAIHNHQPEGNFGEVFESAYDACYVRIVDALEAHPTIKVSLHHTGPLLEWIEANRPQYFQRVRQLVARGQVELLGGGFYEPMLAILPESDAIGQIVMMADYLERHFGQRPRGMWLAERVWEPGLAKVITDAGMKFTLVDDTHFRAAGLAGTLRGYWVTEKAGTALAMFPIDKKLREVIPFSKLEETAQAFAELAAQSDGEGAVTYGDDGEKFGVWPKTADWVWDKGWLKGFFEYLASSPHVRSGHFADELRENPPVGRVYLPTASYEEMGEWALPTATQPDYLALRKDLTDRHQMDRARPFVRGGIWQGFLAKYPEANQMHKRMLGVSARLAEAEHQALTRQGPGHDRENELSIAKRALYRAQCNCAYWHGLFGGIYLNYLRDAVHRQLLVAEAFADGALGAPCPSWANGRGGSPPMLCEVRDLDADLRDEVMLRSSELVITARPHDGGAIESIAYRPKTFLLTNVLARRAEGYHERLRAFVAAGGNSDGGVVSIHDLVQVKEPGLEKLLVYDERPRYSFVDHFLPIDATWEQLASNTATELGDFVGGVFALGTPDNKGVPLARVGTIDGRRVRMHKRIEVEGKSLHVRYALSLESGADLDVVFAPELVLSLLDGHSPERSYALPDRTLPDEQRMLASRGVFPTTQSLSLINRANLFSARLDFGAPVEVWRYPVETVSNSEAGFERTYQGSVVVPRFPVSLRAGAAPISLTLSLTLGDL
jgi:alpha-amylase